MKWISRVAVGVLAGAVTTGLTVAPAHASLTLSSTPAVSWRLDGRVLAEVVVGDTLIVGGNFTTATSPSGTTAPRKDLAAFSMSTGNLITTWRADAGDTVRALATDGTSVWAGGSFGAVSGATHRFVAKLSVATGAVDPAFTAAAGGAVRALVVDGSALYVGGVFTTMDGTTRNRLAKVAASTGALDTTFTAAASGNVYGLAKVASSPRLYVAGAFATLSGATRAGMGVVDATSGAITGPAFAGSVNPTLGVTLNPTGTQVFGATGAKTNAAVGWNASSGTQLWSVTTDGDIQAILYFSGVVYFGFHDGYQGDMSVKLLAANPNTGALGRFRPSFDDFFGVFAIAASNAGLAIGGDFMTVSGVTAMGIARFPDQ